MDSFTIALTPRTPLVQFDPAQGIYILKGKSIPDNSIEFYKPVFDWLTSFLETSPAKFSLTVGLDYYNTSSAKCLADIFKKLQAVHVAGTTMIEVVWEYDETDEDMLESGEDFKSTLKFPFTIKPKNR